MYSCLQCEYCQEISGHDGKRYCFCDDTNGENFKLIKNEDYDNSCFADLCNQYSEANESDLLCPECGAKKESKFDRYCGNEICYCFEETQTEDYNNDDDVI